MAGPALQAAGARSPAAPRCRARSAAAALALLGLLMLIVAPLALLSSIGGGSGQITAAAAGSRRVRARLSTRPPASTSVNGYLLASIADQETASAPARRLQRLNGGCCVGLMQMCVGGPAATWDAHQVRLPPRPAASELPLHDGAAPDVLDSFDNVMAAGVQRGKVGGARSHLDGVAYRALCGYYGACTDGIAGNYAADVLDARPNLAARAGATHRPRRRRSASRSAGLARARAGDVAVLRAPRLGGLPPRRRHRRPSGTPILAAAAGRVSVVQAAGSSGGYGNFTCLQHTSALTTCYAHQAAHPRPRRRDRRPRPADRDLRLHRPLLRTAPALRGPPRRPARLPRPLPRRPARHDVRPGVARLMTAAASISLRSPWRRRSRSPAARTRTHRDQRATRVADGSARPRRATSSDPAHRPARRRTASPPRRVGAARRPVVRDALGQLGLAIAPPASSERSLGSPRGGSPPSCAPTRAAPASTRASRATGPARAAASSRSTSRRATAGGGGSSSRASRPTPTDAPTSAASATASTSSGSTRERARLGGERMGAAAIAARIPLPRAARGTHRGVRARLRRARGPLVAVCGLAGGAGTSTLALCSPARPPPRAPRRCCSPRRTRSTPASPCSPGARHRTRCSSSPAARRRGRRSGRDLHRTRAGTATGRRRAAARATAPDPRRRASAARRGARGARPRDRRLRHRLGAPQHPSSPRPPTSSGASGHARGLARARALLDSDVLPRRAVRRSPRRHRLRARARKPACARCARLAGERCDGSSSSAQRRGRARRASRRRAPHARGRRTRNDAAEGR